MSMVDPTTDSWNTLSRAAKKLVTPDKPLNSSNVVRRQGVITAINSTFTVDITLGGSSIVLGSVKYLQSYYPVVGDTVWVDFKDNDLIVIGSTTNQQWTAYTPVLTATGGGFAGGTGYTIEGRYQRLGKSAWGNVAVTMGNAGFAAGTGDYRITLPITIYMPASRIYIVGQGYYYDTSANSVWTFTCDTAGIGGTGVRMLMTAAAGAWPVGAARPVVVAAGDLISFAFQYEVG